MTTKSIIDIEVNDGAFQRFAALFAKYQEQVAKTPDAWKKVGDEVETVIDKTAEGVEGVSDATKDVEKAASAAAVAFRQTYIQVNNISNQHSKTESGQRSMERSAKAQASYWHDLAKSSHTFAGNITDATRSLLRWVSITGVLGGLLGAAGGLFGIDRLAASASAKRRSASGLGVTPGEESAFNLNYGRVIDPQHFLSGVNESLHDAAKRGWLNVAGGLTEKDLAGKDTAQVANELLPALKRLADHTDPRNLNNVFENRHIGEYMSKEDFQRLKSLSPEEFEKYQKQYQADSKTLNIGDSQLRAWQDLQVQLKRAGETLENVFIKDLSDLAKPIGDLSAGFTHMVDALLKAPLVKQWIEDLAGGLESAAKYISTPEFDKHIQDFVKDVGDLANSVGEAFKTIMNWVHWFENKDGGYLIDKGVNGPIDGQGDKIEAERARRRALKGLPPETAAPSSSSSSSDAPTTSNPYSGYNEKPGYLLRAWERFKRTWQGEPDPPMANGMVGRASYNTIEGQNGLPRGLLQNVEYTESRGRDLVSPAGAQGYFQFMPGTAQRYGVNVHDEGSSAQGAARYLRDLKEMFGGSIEKAVAAYNWGEGNLQKDIDKHGDRWKDYLPAETQNYLQNVIGGRESYTSRPPANMPGTAHQNSDRGDRRVTITVNNNTGGAAAVSTSQLAI